MARFLLAIALVAATLALTLLTHREAPSAQRVAGIRTLIDGVLTNNPRPTGTATNAVMLDRIEALLTTYGYKTERQKTFSCADSGACAPIENLIALNVGTTTNSAILFAAHHDTVPASPGASDDGAGVVAMLEVARELSNQPPLRRTVIFLFTDGEEIALLGARAFVREHRLAHTVGVAVIVEGMGGPTMVELLSRRRTLAQAALAVGTTVIGSSAMAWISSEVVTDANVFDERGIPSLILGGYGQFDRYHSPRDTPQVLDAGAVAARADQTLAWAHTLAGRELDQIREKAVFFDIGGLFWISWPDRAALPIALFAMVLVIIATLRRGGSEAFYRALASAIRFVFLALSIGAFVGLLFLMRAFWVLPGRWAEPQGILRLLAVIVPLAICLLSNRPFFKREDRWSGVWLTFALIGVVLSLFAPELSFSLVAPSMIAGLLGILAAHRFDGVLGTIAAITPILIVAALIAGTYPLAPMMMTARSFIGTGVVHLPLVLALWPLFPDANRANVISGALATIAALALLVMIVTRPPSIGHAQLRLDADADQATSRWLLIGRAKNPLGPGVQLKPDAEPYPWWSGAPVLTLGAEQTVQGAAPELAGYENVRVTGGRRIRGRLRSLRGAEEVSLAIAPGSNIRRIQVEGVEATPSSNTVARMKGWTVVTVYAAGDDGVSIEVLTGTQPELDAVLFDFDRGLPQNDLENKRPPHVVTAHGGDGTILRRRQRL